MRSTFRQSGFTLIELLVAATVFTFVILSVSSLFTQALDLQRRASALQKIQDNAQYVIESISREVRVSTITSGNTDCNPPDTITTKTLSIKHPVNGDVTYAYDRTSGIGVITREVAGGGGPQPITSGDVDFTSFAFCVSGAGVDGQQARVTMPMTITAVSARLSAQVTASLQTTIVSRDLAEELTH